MRFVFLAIAFLAAVCTGFAQTAAPPPVTAPVTIAAPTVPTWSYNASYVLVPREKPQLANLVVNTTLPTSLGFYIPQLKLSGNLSGITFAGNTMGSLGSQSFTGGVGIRGMLSTSNSSFFLSGILGVAFVELNGSKTTAGDGLVGCASLTAGIRF